MKIGIYEECRNCTKDDRRYGFIPYAAVCHSRRQALFPIQKTDEWRKTLDLFWDFFRREKDFLLFQIGFRSLAADCAKILPI